MSEILLENITCMYFLFCFRNNKAVERIEKPRQSYPDLIVIYLLTPSLESLDALIKDWSFPKALKYSQAHLLLTNSIFLFF